MDREREAMFFDAIDKVPRGLIACVFDGTDRLQHTFWRDIDERHPARPDQHVLDGRNVIEDLYRRMDDLVGKTIAKCRPRRHAADGHLRPRIRPVPPRDRPEPLARGERLPDAPRRPRRRGAPRRGRLVADPGLRDRPGRASTSTSRTSTRRASSSPAREADRLREEIAERLDRR